MRQVVRHLRGTSTSLKHRLHRSSMPDGASAVSKHYTGREHSPIIIATPPACHTAQPFQRPFRRLAVVAGHVTMAQWCERSANRKNDGERQYAVATTPASVRAANPLRCRRGSGCALRLHFCATCESWPGTDDFVRRLQRHPRAEQR